MSKSAKPLGDTVLLAGHDDAFRVKKGIVRVTGEIYDRAGKLEQQFEVFYNADGSYRRSRAVFSDGTIQED
jgi:hypothetical protein